MSSTRKWTRASQGDLDRGTARDNNREFETLTKPKYRLSAAADGEDDFIEQSLCVVDLAAVLRDPADLAARATLAAELGGALAEAGFALLVGHGVPSTLYEAAHERIPAFFEGRSAGEKEACMAERFGAVNQGYFPVGETSNLHPDQVEGWVWCRRAFLLGAAERAGGGGLPPATLWPGDAAAREEEERFWRAIVQAHHPLLQPLFSVRLPASPPCNHLRSTSSLGDNRSFPTQHLAKPLMSHLAQAMLQYVGADPSLSSKLPAEPPFALRLKSAPKQPSSRAGWSNRFQ